MKNKCFLSFVFSILFIAYACEVKPRTTGTRSKNGMVVTEHPLASKIGADILKNGGNAFDAAIAVQFALAVVLPRAGNISGGGFMVYRQGSGENGFLDFRETAPLKAHADMYLDETNNVIPALSVEGALASGIPGTVDGMVKTHKKFGTLPMDKLIEPAIKLAKEGHFITKDLADRLNKWKKLFIRVNHIEEEDFEQYPFVKTEEWKEGDEIYFKKLGNTLETIKNAPYEEFYRGETGKKMVEALNERGGIFSTDGLAQYKAVWRDPVIGEYKGHKIISAAPPSSGGTALLQILSMASFYDLKGKKHNSASYIHVLAEIENRVFADRSKYLGDPDFFKIPTEELTHSEYIRSRIADINEEKKTDVIDIAPGNLSILESMETTHFSIVDKAGNAVSITTTLNANFGSLVYLPELGFFMNNEMDDFSSSPNHPNEAGLLGGEFNAIAPKKRMLSSMTPTLIEKDGKLKMVLGTPGGPTIITSVAQVILNVLEFDMTMQEAVNAKRFHSQWYPDRIMMEKELAENKEVQENLNSMGHEIKKVKFIGKVEALLIEKDGETIEGAADLTRCTSKAIGID